jgi:hypothetical protein
MTIKYCEECGEPMFTNIKHHCADPYYFWHPDYGDTMTKVHAWTFNHAAEEVCEKLFESDPELERPETIVVTNGREQRIYRVQAEPTIEYNATEIEDDKEILKDKDYIKAMDNFVGKCFKEIYGET